MLDADWHWAGKVGHNINGAFENEFSCDVSTLHYHIEESRFRASAESDRYAIVGELRLDNAHELWSVSGSTAARDNLVSAPSVNSSRILLRALERFGERAFDMIEGEFALVVLDKTKHQVILVRDALGRRPLFFSRRRSVLHIGSYAPQVALRAGYTGVDYTEIAKFLQQRGQDGPRSFFASVERVEPGSLVRFDTGGVALREQWWKPDLSSTPLRDHELLEALAGQLERSVSMILHRHEKVSAHLSAGMDSSLAVATASSQLPVGARLPALCISAGHSVDSAGNGPICDEYPMAQQTATMLGNVDLRRVVPSNDDWLSLNDRFTAAAGMPYRNVANLGWFAASYAVAKELGSSGLMEATDGNATMSWLGDGAVPTLLRQFNVSALFRLIADARNHSTGSGLMIIPRGIWAMLPPDIANPLAGLAGVKSAASQGFLRHDHPAVLAASQETRAAGHWNRILRPSRSAADRLTYLNWSDKAPHFAGVERAFGIELCDPFAAKRLVELTLRIEEPRYLHEGWGRRFARLLLRGRVPEVVADGRVDWLQATDWRTGAIARRSVLLADIDYAENTELSALLDLPRLRTEVQGWSNSRENARSMDGAERVLRAIGVIRFVRWATDYQMKPRHCEQ